jgi:hypothetical protein
LPIAHLSLEEAPLMAGEKRKKRWKKPEGNKRRRMPESRSNLSLNRSVWSEKESRRKGRRRQKRRLEN